MRMQGDMISRNINIEIDKLSLRDCSKCNLRTLMRRRPALLLSCSLMATMTSVSACPSTCSVGSSTSGALPATASSVSMSSFVSEPGASACTCKGETL